jgi:hypothetical protein
MIVLQEIDYSDSDQVLSDGEFPYIRHRKAIAAAGPVPAAAILSQPSRADLAQTAHPLPAYDSVDSSETDSAVTMGEMAPGVSDHVDLQERTALDDVELNLIADNLEVAHHGDASAQVCLLNWMCALVFVCRACHSFCMLMFSRVSDVASTHIFSSQRIPETILLLKPPD